MDKNQLLEIKLTFLSSILDLIQWHEYLDDQKNMSDKKIKKIRNDFIKLIEEAKGVCDQIITPETTRQNMIKILQEYKTNS